MERLQVSSAYSKAAEIPIVAALQTLQGFALSTLDSSAQAQVTFAATRTCLRP